MFNSLKAYFQAQQGLLGLEASVSSVPRLMEELQAFNRSPENSLGYLLYFWHYGEGLREGLDAPEPLPTTNEPIGVLNYIEDQLLDFPGEGRIYCLWQLSPHLRENRLVKAKLLSQDLRSDPICSVSLEKEVRSDRSLSKIFPSIINYGKILKKLS